MRANALKPINREYYYIDYQRAIDSTKFRIHMLNNHINASLAPTKEKPEYICPQCSTTFTVMEVLDSIDPRGRGSGFLCKKCGFLLKSVKEGDDEDEFHGHDEIPARFNKQFGTILNLLQQIDEVNIPPVTGESALAAATPIPRDENINPQIKSEPVVQHVARPTSVKGILTGPEKIEISITTSADNNAAEQAAEAQRKARIAAQNQLPAWHTQSTVSGDIINAGHNTSTKAENDASQYNKLGEDDDREDKKTLDPSMEAYFAALEEERKRKAQESDEDDEEDEEDEDEFEDVVSTPAANALDMNGTPPAKRVKLEVPDNKNGKVEDGATPASTSTPAGVGGDDDSDADEFEDAM